MSVITTHVLDTSRGAPAVGVEITLLHQSDSGAFIPIGTGVTNSDGRALDLMRDTPMRNGQYRLVFRTGAWFSAQGRETFYPVVEITFEVTDAAQHYHVPLLLSPFGYSTYRGS